MIEIKDLLVRFDKLINNEEIKILLIREAIKDVVGIDIEIDKIKFTQGVLYLNIKSIYKNEIFINKDKILFHLEKNSSSQKINKFF
jgi:hypothetical protein